MKYHTLTIIIVVLGALWALAVPVVGELIAVGVWIYIIWIVRKQKTEEISDQADLNTSELLQKRLRLLFVIALFSILAFITGAIIHNVIYGLYDYEELVFLLAASAAHIIFILTTAIGLLVFLLSRIKK